MQHVVNEMSEARLRVFGYKSLDMETKLVRNNIVFSGLSESDSGDNCVQLLSDFLKKHIQYGPCSTSGNFPHRSPPRG